jgi:hypothetical protein
VILYTSTAHTVGHQFSAPLRRPDAFTVWALHSVHVERETLTAVWHCDIPELAKEEPQ